MGACIKSCCLSEAGMTCHLIITLLGALYFFIMYLIFEAQRNFFNIVIEHQKDTKLGFLLSFIIYLVFFLILLVKIIMGSKNKEKKIGHKQSLSEMKDLVALKDKKNKVLPVSQLYQM